MKKLLGLCSLAIMMTSCQEEQKIGFVDNGEIIKAYQEKIDLEDKFKLRETAFTKRRDSMGQAFQSEAQAFQAEVGKMSQQKQQEQYQMLGQKQQMLQQQIQYEQQQLTQEFSTEIDSIVSRVRKFVQSYGKENGYTYILGSNEAGSVLYGKDALDISDEVIKALNDNYKKGATAADTKVENETTEDEK